MIPLVMLLRLLSNTSATTGSVPYVDPRLQQLWPVIDSLMVATGVSPDSILFRAPQKRESFESGDSRQVVGRYEVPNRSIWIAPNAPDPRETLLHEYGHAYQMLDQKAFWNWLYPGGIQDGPPVTRDDVEGFARQFSRAFAGLHHPASGPPGEQLLRQQMLQRLTGSSVPVTGTAGSPTP